MTPTTSAATRKEDEILREWTPVILRTLLIVAALVLVIGLVVVAWSAPGYYVERFRAAQHGRPHPRQEWSQMGKAALNGDPRSILCSILMAGLLVLTLMPLGRVAFTFVLFLKEKDRIFALATAYVLVALILGVMLGRIG
jgi:uncharacterized membrane protein